MKTKYFILLSILIVMLLSGCQDLTEDPKALLSPNTYFKTQADLDASVTAIYQSFTVDHGTGSVSFFCSAFGADDLSAHPASNKFEMREYDQLNPSLNNFRIGRNWSMLWNGITQANNVIANYKKVESTDELKNGSAAQAYFWRAFCYFRLVKEFGELPLVLEPVNVDARPPRVSVTEIYDVIVNDLQTALSLFPPSFLTMSNRANPLATKAFLAEVYLNMTGWPLNLTNNYSLAAASANDVIQSGKFTLVPDYATVFTTNENSEAVFSIKFNLAGGFGASIARMWGMFVVPEAEHAASGGDGWHDFTTEKNFYRNAPKCKRSWQTFYDTLKVWDGATSTFKLNPWDSVGTKQVFFKKFRYGLGIPGNGDGCTETAKELEAMSPSSGKDAVLIRYAKVLLDYAEASAMAAGAPSAASYDAINLVRRRAGLPDLTAGLSATAFQDSVVHERAYEFAGEYGIRWYDIQRLQLLPEVIAQRDPNETNLISPAIAADPSTRYLAPIPQDEMYRNPDWTQNPGY